ncbi:MAG: phasin family protein [Cellvibrionaceae bacterium]
MFDQISSKIQESMTPITKLAEVNVKAMEQLTQAQSSLFNNLVSSNVAFAQELAAQKDIAGVVALQKSFAEDLQEKLSTAAKESYALLAETQEKATELLKGAFAQAQEAAATVAPKASKASK